MCLDLAKYCIRPRRRHLALPNANFAPYTVGNQQHKGYDIMTENIANATALKAEVFRQMVDEETAVLAELLTQVRLQEKLITSLQAKLAAVSATEPQAKTSEVPPKESTSSAIDLRKPWDGLSLSMPLQVASVLRMKERPMRVTEIVQRLEELGVRSNSKKGILPNVVSALTRRDDLFEKKARGIYALRDAPGGTPKNAGE